MEYNLCSSKQLLGSNIIMINDACARIFFTIYIHHRYNNYIIRIPIAILYGDSATIGKLSIMEESHISEIDLNRKWRRYGSFFGLRTQKGSPVAHSPYNILYVAR